VLCHYGSSHRPPAGLKPGDVVTGSDGQRWAYTGDTSDSRAAKFTPDKPRQIPAPPSTKGTRHKYSETFYVVRFDSQGGTKTVRPLRYNGKDWEWKAPAGLRPLLLSKPLASDPGASVLIVEGEKTFDAAKDLLPGFICCCWSGGCKAISKTDFSSLKGRRVVLWPDNDEPGIEAMQRLAQTLHDVGASSVQLIANPPDRPTGWDLADATDWSAADALQWLEGHAEPVERQGSTELAEINLPSAPDRRAAADFSKPIKLNTAQIVKLLPDRVGELKLNTRTQEITADGIILSGNKLSRLYLKLSDSSESWPKEQTYDAAIELAESNSFDPVADYLNANQAKPLPLADWQRLDKCLLGIDDPIAAEFLPRYLVAAVARTFEPGCDFRQTPVLVGPQWIGKTAAGRILFGAEYFTSGIGDISNKDSLDRCHQSWGVELAELDGITRRSDQEALKAFLSETSDLWRAPYDKASERRRRRFLFWGTSNGAALRDTTGSTRFVCIPVKEALPLDWIEQHRDAIWARAVEQYRSGFAWQECNAASREAIAERNSNYQEEDPWLERVELYLKRRELEDHLPVQITELLDRLEVPKERQGNRESKRVQQLAESLGWKKDRRRIGELRLKGLWPGVSPNCRPHRPHHGHTMATPPEPLPCNGSGSMATPGTPKSKELETANTETTHHMVHGLWFDEKGTIERFGVAGVAAAPNPNQRRGSEESGGVAGGVAGVAGGVAGVAGGVAAAPIKQPDFLPDLGWAARTGSGYDAVGDSDDPRWPERKA
jgi:predicted P-loop ATPase